MPDEILAGTHSKRTVWKYGDTEVFALSADEGAQIKDAFGNWIPVSGGLVTTVGYTLPLYLSAGYVYIYKATALQNGYLSAVDWSTFNAKEPAVSTSTSGYYYRGDKTWAILNKSTIGLDNVENTALSTWAGSTNILTVGTIGTGVWHGTSISTSYTDAKVTSVCTRTGAVTISASDIAAGTFTGAFTFSSTLTTNISGNSETVTNGVYSNATYTNPSWLSTLAGSKITGANSVAASVLPANLTSLSALTYASLSFVKMSASGTFSLDTNAYITDAPSDGTCYGRKNAAWATTSGLRWLGAYNPLTAYIIDDGVSYAGSSYICILPTTGNLPTDATYWQLLAQMGTPGVSGISGSVTQAFTSQTSVNVVHNFNSYPAVQVLEGTTVIIPLSIVHNTTNDFTVTFTSATSGTIVATIGGVATTVVTKSSDYTITAQDNLILAIAALTLTLPATSGNQGKTYSIKHMTDSGIPVVVTTTGGKTIDGELTKTLIAKYTTLTVFTDGSNWFII